MTATQLLAALTAAGCRPDVEASKLVFKARPPRSLLVAVRVLQTGLRAAITGRRWHAVDPATGRPCGPRPADPRGPLAFGAISPSELIPANAGLLCVEGDVKMDRIHHAARIDLPQLFEMPEANVKDVKKARPTMAA